MPLLPRPQSVCELLGQRIGLDPGGFDEALFLAADLGDQNGGAPAGPLFVHRLQKIQPHQSSLST